MDKKIIFPPIIIGGFLLQIFFMFSLESIFISLGVSDNTFYFAYNFLIFICAIPFFILILSCFRTDKLMIAFAALSILTMFINAIIISRTLFFIGAILSLGALLTAFVIALQEKYNKVLRYSLVSVAVIYFGLTSTIMIVLNFMFRTLIGDTPYLIFYLVLMIGVIVAEVICILYLIRYDKDKRRKNPNKSTYTFVDGEYVKTEE